MKPKIKSRGIIITAAAIFLLASVPVSIYAYNNHNYQKLITQGNNNVENEDFDRAVESYKQSLKYNKKRESEIKTKIEVAEDLKASKEMYLQAVQLLDSKKYIEAIDAFQQIPKETEKYYVMAQEKISLSKSEFIKEHLESAKNSAQDKKYEEAIGSLDILLKYDSNNEEASNLKEQYNAEINRLKEEERKKAEQLKKEEEEKKRQAEAEKAKQQQKSETKSAPKANETTKQITSEVEGTTLRIYDEDKTITVQFRILRLNGGFLDYYMTGVETDKSSAFSLKDPALDYTINFKYDGKVTKVSDKTSGSPKNKSAEIKIEYYNPNNVTRVDTEISVNYKGKAFKFTVPFNITY